MERTFIGLLKKLQPERWSGGGLPPPKPAPPTGGRHGRGTWTYASGERWEGDECVLYAEGEVLQASQFGEHLLLRLLALVDLKEQVENLAGRVNLFNRQSVLIPGDLRKVKIFPCLKHQRLETRAVPNQIGYRLING